MEKRGEVLYFLVDVVQIVFRIMELLVLARVILSWIPLPRGNALTEFIYDVTEPVLAPFRRLLPMGQLDFSPFLALIVLGLVESLVVRVVLML